MVEVETDHVIAATGYQVNLDRLQYLSPSLRARTRTFERVPVLDQVFQSSVPGLHFVGVTSAQSFGPVMRFVYGAKHAATTLTRYVRKSSHVRTSGLDRSYNQAVNRQTVARQAVARQTVTRPDTSA
jgi:hypothetical protein